MARIFVTGSSTGLGFLAGKSLLGLGHDVVFHARDARRADDIRRELGRDATVVTGDLDTIAASRDVADQVNRLGSMDAVIHNAGIGYGRDRDETVDGLPQTFAVNVLAPYILTAAIARPRRVIYLSSGMHRTAPNLDDALWQRRRWSGSTAYAESKLYDTMLAFAVARLWPEVRSNAVDPGWVPTRMGGRGAPDDLAAGYATQVALAAPTDPRLAALTGQYLHHLHPRPAHAPANDPALQDELLELCRKLSGLTL